MSRRQYANPPILEALCEVRFAPASEWDLTVPMRLYGELRADYAGKPRQQPIIALPLGVTPVAGEPVPIPGEVGTRTQFVDENGTRALGVSEHTLALSMFPPYPGWETFREYLRQAFEKYVEVAQPVAVTRIGVRYINRIVLPSGADQVTNYFSLAPHLPSDFPNEIAVLHQRLEGVYPEPPVRLISTLASAGMEGNRPAVLLDLDVIREWSDDDSLPLDEAFDQIESLRDRERVVFEAAITDRTRALFG